MEGKNILQAALIDIIFDGRNKDYGAYQLRKTYNSRMAMALVVTTALVSFLFAGYLIAGNSKSIMKDEPVAPDIHLVELEPQRKTEEPLPMLPVPEPPKAAVKQFTTPIIVASEDVSEDQKPPEVQSLEQANIGLINVDGVDAGNVVAPPANCEGKGIVAVPEKARTNYDSTFIVVEIESQYPGGTGAWMRYLNKTFRYPEAASEEGTQGTIIVQFIVDREGNVSEVEAVSGPASGGLREEAVRVIKKSGKWEAAVQNGRKVKSYKKQPITFKLDSE